MSPQLLPAAAPATGPATTSTVGSTKASSGRDDAHGGTSTSFAEMVTGLAGPGEEPASAPSIDSTKPSMASAARPPAQGAANVHATGTPEHPEREHEDDTGAAPIVDTPAPAGARADVSVREEAGGEEILPTVAAMVVDSNPSLALGPELRPDAAEDSGGAALAEPPMPTVNAGLSASGEQAARDRSDGVQVQAPLAQGGGVRSRAENVADPGRVATPPVGVEPSARTERKEPESSGEEAARVEGAAPGDLGSAHAAAASATVSMERPGPLVAPPSVEAVDTPAAPATAANAARLPVPGDPSVSVDAARSQVVLQPVATGPAEKSRRSRNDVAGDGQASVPDPPDIEPRDAAPAARSARAPGRQGEHSASLDQGLDLSALGVEVVQATQAAAGESQPSAAFTRPEPSATPDIPLPVRGAPASALTSLPLGEFARSFALNSYVASSEGAALPAATEPWTLGPFEAELPHQQVVRAVRLQWASGVSEARLRLHPEHLGEVTIDLRVERGRVFAALRLDNPSAAEWIRAQRTELQASLGEQGLDLGSLEIVVDPDGRRRQAATPEPPARARVRHQNADSPRFEVLV